MIATWGSPSDPSVYAPLVYDVTKTLAYLKKVNNESKDIKITMTHIFSMAMAWGMAKNRRDVGRLTWGNF